MKDNKFGKFIAKFVKKNITKKTLLYAFLVFLFISTMIIYVNNKDSGLAQNFLAGSIEVLITVLVIERLIDISRNESRNKKYLMINSELMDGLKLTCDKLVIDFGDIVNHEFEKKERTIEIFEYKNQEIAGVANKILNGNGFKDVVQQFMHDEEFAVEWSNINDDKLAKNLGEILKKLEKTKPYLNPDITKRINKSGITLNVHRLAIDETKKLIDVAKNSGNKDIYKFMKNNIWDGLVRGAIGVEDQSLEYVCRSYLDTLIYIHKQCEDGKIHYEIS